MSLWHRECSRWYKLSKMNMPAYTQIEESQLLKTPKSETCVIFGSGYSLNSLPKETWAHLSAFDTIGFSWFVHQNFIRLDYLLIREVLMEQHILEKETFKMKLELYQKELQKPLNKNALIIIQNEFSSRVTNFMLSNMIIPKKRRVFTYFNLPPGPMRQPSATFSQGLVHGSSTLMDVLNFAYIMGWKQIILAGIDLYDRRYFWLPYDKLRDDDPAITPDSLHNTAHSTVTYIKNWLPFFKNRNLNISVLNPKSLLTEIVPVYSFKEVK